MYDGVASADVFRAMGAAAAADATLSSELRAVLRDVLRAAEGSSSVDRLATGVSAAASAEMFDSRWRMSAIVPRCFSCSFLAAVCPALSSRIVSGVSGLGTRKDVLVTTSTERPPPQQLQVAPMSV